MTSHAIPTSAQIRAIYGSIVLANVLTCWLFGVVLLLLTVRSSKTYIYWQGCRHDTIWMRIFVLLLIGISLVGSGACCSRTWKAIIEDFGEPLRYFQATHAEDRIVPLTSNITAVLTELFLAFKAFSYARAMGWTSGIRGRVSLFMIGGLFLIGWIANAGMALGVPLWAITHPSLGEVTLSDGLTWKPFVKFWLNLQVGSFVGVDALLTICLASELLSVQSLSSATHAVISSIVGLLLRQGVVILMCRIAQLLVINKVSGPWSNYFFSFIGQIYNVTVLAFLLRPRATRHRVEGRLAHQEQGLTTSIPAMPTDRDLSMVKRMDGLGHSGLDNATLPSSGVHVLPSASIDADEDELWPSGAI